MQTGDVETAPLLEVRGLGRRFGAHWALAHVDLELGAGEGLLVVGANGAGKSTLLRLITGLLRPHAGGVRVCGFNVEEHTREARARLSRVGPGVGFHPRLSGAESLEFWDGRAGPGPGPGEAARSALLEEAGLADCRDRPVATYSSGQRQRLALARARLERPRLLLLDEPFTALDTGGRAWLATWLRRLQGEGVGWLLATHELEPARELCPQALRLDAGQVVWRGPSRELLDGGAPAAAGAGGA